MQSYPWINSVNNMMNYGELNILSSYVFVRSGKSSNYSGSIFNWKIKGVAIIRCGWVHFKAKQKAMAFFIIVDRYFSFMFDGFNRKHSDYLNRFNVV